MFYLGLDQSLTNTGLCVLDGSNHRPQYLTTVVTGKLRGAERLAQIRDDVLFATRKYHITQAALEGYSFESVNRSFDLGELGGVIRLCLHDAKIPFLIVPPTSLKKFVTGNGSADKQKMHQAVLAKWEQDIPNDEDDQCDAYGLAQVARAYAVKNSTNRAELEVLRGLDLKPSTLSAVAKGSTKVSL